MKDKNSIKGKINEKTNVFSRKFELKDSECALIIKEDGFEVVHPRTDKLTKIDADRLNNIAFNGFILEAIGRYLEAGEESKNTEKFYEAIKDKIHEIAEELILKDSK